MDSYNGLLKFIKSFDISSIYLFRNDGATTMYIFMECLDGALLTPQGSICRGGRGLSKRNGGGGSRLAGGGGGAPGGVTLLSPGSRHTTSSTVLGVVRRTSRASCNK